MKCAVLWFYLHQFILGMCVHRCVDVLNRTLGAAMWAADDRGGSRAGEEEGRLRKNRRGGAREEAAAAPAECLGSTAGPIPPAI